MVKNADKIIKRLGGINLQLFAEGGENPEGGATDPQNTLNLQELLKDETFKKQYEDALKVQLAQRFKKFEGIDVEEYKRLKEEETKKKESEMSEVEKLQKQIADKEVELEKFKKSSEIMTKKEIVLDYAVKNGYDPKLATRLVDLNSMKLVEGNVEDIEGIFSSLAEEFPQVVVEKGDNTDGAEGKEQKPVVYGTGSRSKGNDPKPTDKYDIGKNKALSRHKKD